jgi:hypothetical protein
MRRVGGERHFMGGDDAKILFAVYREAGNNGPYRVIYFTELDEKERDAAIERFVTGETVYQAYLREDAVPGAKPVIEERLERWNAGEKPDAGSFQAAMRPYLAE